MSYCPDGRYRNYIGVAHSSSIELLTEQKPKKQKVGGSVSLFLGLPCFLFFEYTTQKYSTQNRGAGAGPAGTAAVGPMLEAKLMNLIKGRLQKFWLSNNFSVQFTRIRVPAASPDQSWYASDATAEVYYTEV